jgi:hypothetical protein
MVEIPIVLAQAALVMLLMVLAEVAAAEELVAISLQVHFLQAPAVLVE